MLSEDARARIRQLATDFPRAWKDASVAPVERKRMVALLIDDVTIVKAQRIMIHVRFRGGATTSFEIDKPRPIAAIRKISAEVIRAIDVLLETCADHEVAEQLTQRGYRTWQGCAFTARKIIIIRKAYQLRSRQERLRARGMLNAQELAQQLGICSTTVRQWARAGLLRKHNYGTKFKCLYEPPPADIILTKGTGGRQPTPPSSIIAPTLTQGAL